MTATRIPGTPFVDQNQLVSTNPATGDEVDRFPVATPAEVEAAVARARKAAAWWAGLGFAGRRARLLRFRAVLARRMPELAALMRREGGKPEVDAIVEIAGAIDHVQWSANNARRVLRLRRVRSSPLQLEFGVRLEYQPLGVVGVIGPWNYPVFTPLGSIAYALAAGNAVVYKPSEYTPAVGQWLVERFAEVVPEQPVMQIVHGLGDAGAALCRAGVDKVAFTGSTATGKKVMAACAESLTPVLVECGGKDAMIVDADADLAAAADAALWGGVYNAGQTCIGIERVYVVESVADEFVTKLVAQAKQLKVGFDEDSTVGPITMPSQVEIIRRHITAAVEAGATVAIGGVDAVRPPYVDPTILVDVPESSPAVCEETFGPVLVVNRVRDTDEAIEKANAVSYGLGGAVFSRRARRALELARRMRSGMTSVNSALSFAGQPGVPFGGVGDSGFGRIHGDDGLREFSRPKSITTRRARSLLPATTFRRDPAVTARRLARIIRLVHGRG
jgi:succinate-semialdehyde dehydrogenase / glutarate-semialdehyde dehydrogenase